MMQIELRTNFFSNMAQIHGETPVGERKYSNSKQMSRQLFGWSTGQTGYFCFLLDCTINCL